MADSVLDELEYQRIPERYRVQAKRAVDKKASGRLDQALELGRLYHALSEWPIADNDRARVRYINILYNHEEGLTESEDMKRANKERRALLALYRFHQEASKLQPSDAAPRTAFAQLVARYMSALEELNSANWETAFTCWSKSPTSSRVTVTELRQWLKPSREAARAALNPPAVTTEASGAPASASSSAASGPAAMDVDAGMTLTLPGGLSSGAPAAAAAANGEGSGPAASAAAAAAVITGPATGEVEGDDKDEEPATDSEDGDRQVEGKPAKAESNDEGGSESEGQTTSDAKEQPTRRRTRGSGRERSAADPPVAEASSPGENGARSRRRTERRHTRGGAGHATDGGGAGRGGSGGGAVAQSGTNGDDEEDTGVFDSADQRDGYHSFVSGAVREWPAQADGTRVDPAMLDAVAARIKQTDSILQQFRRLAPAAAKASDKPGPLLESVDLTFGVAELLPTLPTVDLTVSDCGPGVHIASIPNANALMTDDRIGGVLLRMPLPLRPAHPTSAIPAEHQPASDWFEKFQLAPQKVKLSVQRFLTVDLPPFGDESRLPSDGAGEKCAIARHSDFRRQFEDGDNKVRTIVSRASGAADGRGKEEKKSGATSHKALSASFLNTISSTLYMVDQDQHRWEDKKITAANHPYSLLYLKRQDGNLLNVIGRVGYLNDFGGFIRPYSYFKRPDNFFRIHIEQVFAPSINTAHRGRTEWFLVPPSGLEQLRQFLRRHIKQFVPGADGLSGEDEEALDVLFYAKAIMPDPEALIAAGVPLRRVVQGPDEVIELRGDSAHFGRCLDAEAVAEAVNFLPASWLEYGPRRTLEFLQFFDRLFKRKQENGLLKKSPWKTLFQDDVLSRALNICPHGWARGFFTLLAQDTDRVTGSAAASASASAAADVPTGAPGRSLVNYGAVDAAVLQRARVELDRCLSLLEANKHHWDAFPNSADEAPDDIVEWDDPPTTSDGPLPMRSRPAAAVAAANASERAPKGRKRPASSASAEKGSTQPVLKRRRATDAAAGGMASGVVDLQQPNMTRLNGPPAPSRVNADGDGDAVMYSEADAAS